MPTATAGTGTEAVTGSAAKAAATTTGATDTFGRTVTGGWGSATTGGAWSLTGGAQSFSVSGGEGRLTAAGAGWRLTSQLPAAARTSTEVQSTIALAAMPTGSGSDVDILGRSIDLTHGYRLRVKILPTGVVRAAIVADNATATTMGEVNLPGLTYQAGKVLQVRLQVTGTNPTTVSAKVWDAATAQPTAWQLTATSSTAALQKAGGVGYSLYTSSSTTALPVTAVVDNLWAGAPADAPVLLPPNTAPVATFAASTNELTVSVDSSASTDPDGTIVSRSWGFGDGATATGTTTGHAYAQAGSYPVTLTVTDDRGAVKTANSTITVKRTLAKESFARAAAGGWGTADAGGPWTLTGSATSFSADTRTGMISVPTAGARRAAHLDDIGRRDSEVQATVSLDKVPNGAGTDIDVAARSVADTDGYRLRLTVSPSGVVHAALVSLVAGTATTLTQLDLSGVTFVAGDKLRVRFQVEGTSPTTLRARVWESTLPQPTTWQLTTQNSASQLQRIGAVAVGVATSSTTTNLPVTAAFDDIWSGAIADAPVFVDPPAVLVPGASNTGVPVGTALTVYNGDLTISTPGQVVSGLDIHGFVKVTAPGVIIRNSIIRGTATTVARALVTSAADTASVTIEDSELYAAYPSGWIDGVRGWNITARRVNVHDVIDGFHLYGNNTTIESSWIHDNLHYESDPNQGGGPSHDDSIQIQKGTSIRIANNSISGAFNTGIQLTQDQGAVSNVTITGNNADGGGCTINLAEKGVGPFQGIVVTANTFGRDTKIYNCAIISPTTTTVTTTGNVFTDGTTATVRKGS